MTVSSSVFLEQKTKLSPSALSCPTSQYEVKVGEILRIEMTVFTCLGSTEAHFHVSSSRQYLFSLLQELQAAVQFFMLWI